MDYLYYVLGCIVNVVYTISSMLCFFVCLFVLVLHIGKTGTQENATRVIIK